MNTYSFLVQQLQQDPTTLVLTANRRLASQLMHTFQLAEEQAGRTVWKTPTILPLTSWLDNCYQELLERNCLQKLLLQPYQALAIWEDIINQSTQENELLQPQACAKNAQSAWGLLASWEIPLNETLFNHNEDCHRFYQWANAFQSYCRGHEFLDSAELPANIINFIQQGNIQLPKRIYFFGFLEFPPIFERLIKIAKQQHVECEKILPTQTQTGSQAYYLPLNHTNEELVAMANWAYKLVVNGEKGMIGCVIPLMSELHNEAARIFKKVSLHDPSIVFSYNISGGKALNDYAIIYDALQILKLGKGSIQLNDFSRLLLSPYLYLAEQEHEHRAALDAELLANHYPQINLETLITILKSKTNATSPTFTFATL
jgi:ATP-dependent helicase/nuclease subunit B